MDERGCCERQRILHRAPPQLLPFAERRQNSLKVRQYLQLNNQPPLRTSTSTAVPDDSDRSHSLIMLVRVLALIIMLSG
jgi:hypothetical protein